MSLDDDPITPPYDTVQARRDFVMLRDICRLLHCRPEEALEAVRVLVAKHDALTPQQATP